MLEQQADTLNKLCDMLPTSSVTECADLLSHPLSSLEELQEFDDKLDAGKFKILVHELTQLGGKDAYWATKRILSYCITDEVAAQFSWMGRKGKLSFSALKIAKAIAGVLYNTPYFYVLRRISLPQKKRKHAHCSNFCHIQIRMSVLFKCCLFIYLVSLQCQLSPLLWVAYFNTARMLQFHCVLKF
ncbi:uncharacterized protein [Dermacentor albipictus]|uniref:uncharacterized protein n=1 Tax=Dermacentor albipictus TaxID=60249 RepID=UPI0038FC22E1